MIASTFSKERKQFMRMLRIKLHFSLKRAEKAFHTYHSIKTAGRVRLLTLHDCNAHF